MRIRITQRPQGEVDGVLLNRLELGQVYDVNASIATYLMVSGCAEAVPETVPPQVVPLDFTAQFRNRVNSLTEQAADRTRKKR